MPADTPVTLNEAEREFVAEMGLEPERIADWQRFDPPFRHADTRRLLARGWFERRGKGRDRQWRWTEAGLAALAAPSPATGVSP